MNSKNFLLVLLSSAAALPMIAQPAKAQDCSNYASYMIVNGQCVDMTDVSERGAQGLKQADLLRQQNPIIEQNFRVIRDPDDENYASVTDKLYNQSRRSVYVDRIVVRLTDYNMRDVTEIVRVSETVLPGQTVTFQFSIDGDTINLNNARATLVNSMIE